LKTAGFQGHGLCNRIFARGFQPMTISCGALPRILLAAISIVTLVRAEGIAQPCNPAIDGTYCAEQMGRGSGSTVTTSRSNPSLGREAFSIVRDNDPATFGAITFGGGTGCIGILRRSGCN
jgi:hypothetical protein